MYKVMFVQTSGKKNRIKRQEDDLYTSETISSSPIQSLLLFTTFLNPLADYEMHFLLL